MKKEQKRVQESEKLLERRCPRLGGPVTFHYCRTCSEGKGVCWKVIDCWWEMFDVVRYLQDTLPEEEFKKLVNAQPKPKMTSLLELVDKVKQQKGTSTQS